MRHTLRQNRLAMVGPAESIRMTKLNPEMMIPMTCSLPTLKWLRTLLDRTNDPQDDFHYDLYRPLVIGRDINASRGIVHIDLTSPWFLFNILRVIASGWVFQLNGYATLLLSCGSRHDRTGREFGG
jgi:hypothetical protein